MYIWWADSARVSNKNVHNSQIISYLSPEMIFLSVLKEIANYNINTKTIAQFVLWF